MAVNPLLSSARDKLRLMHEDLYWEMVVSVVGKGSLLADPANQLAQRLIESGLLLHWEAHAAHKWDQTALRHAQTVQGPTRLTTAHLAGTFVLWAAALALSAVVFVFEIFFDNSNH
jgi:hypothetical protein